MIQGLLCLKTALMLPSCGIILSTPDINTVKKWFHFLFCFLMSCSCYLLHLVRLICLVVLRDNLDRPIRVD